MHELRLPRFGQTMELGTILEWRRGVGESYDVGDVLYVMQTDKVDLDIDAKRAGTLARVLVAPGEEVPVGTIVAVAADPGEDAAAYAEWQPSPDDVASDEAAAPAEAATERRAGRRSGVRASPRARALAERLGVDLAGLEPSDGRSISAADVERGAGASAPLARIRARVSVDGVGRAMIRQVEQSVLIPQFVQMIDVDATSLVARRARLVADGRSVTFNDLLVVAVVKAAQEEPRANATYDGSHIAIFEDVNVTLAVASDARLFVPVLARAQELSLDQISERTRALVERAKSGTLAREEVEGGTITLSNLGMFGVDTGTPLVVPPQATIVFAGAIRERGVVVDGVLGARPTMGVAVGFDHRVLTGTAAASFTRALRGALEADGDA
jgi:pyruvate dehydrogenase E2 component (dihydrolipoamide acetyltransferase)